MEVLALPPIELERSRCIHANIMRKQKDDAEILY